MFNAVFNNIFWIKVKNFILHILGDSDWKLSKEKNRDIYDQNFIIILKVINYQCQWSKWNKIFKKLFAINKDDSCTRTMYPGLPDACHHGHFPEKKEIGNAKYTEVAEPVHSPAPIRREQRIFGWEGRKDGGGDQISKGGQKA